MLRQAIVCYAALKLMPVCLNKKALLNKQEGFAVEEGFEPSRGS
jgi:hypothetical protein